MRLLVLLSIFTFCLQAQANRCDFEFHGHGTGIEFMEFLKKLTKVKSAKQLSRYAGYPMRLNGKNRTEIKNKSQFLKRSKDIWTDDVKIALKTKFKIVFCNYQGVMLGKGNIWFKYDKKKKTYKIIAINP